MGKLSRRVTDVILVCEDRQHEAFARRFLKLTGIQPKRIRVLRAPSGEGSGERWVKETYPKEVKAHRQNSHIKGRGLIVIVDEDTQSTTPRAKALEESLESANLPNRAVDERILHVIPARNIETWIAYLDGLEVDETKTYPKLPRERDCSDAVKTLFEMCQKHQLREPSPPSLEATCGEYQARWV